MDKKFISSWNIEDYEIETDTGWSDIIALHKTIPYEIYIIKTSLGKELKCADNHILFNKNHEEVFVKDLNINDIIITCNGVETITYIKNTNVEDNMYDFELPENSNHRYFTNGILSHNTLIAKTIAKMLDVPFAICDATSLTEAGYVGDDVESILHKLLQAADFNVEEAEKGIIFIDEIDKLARKGANTSITRDVSGEGVQQGLLKIIEGTVVGVPPSGGRKHPEQPLIDINTKNILFICGGAFDGIEKRIKERCNLQSVGFNATIERAETDEENLLNKVSSVDIKSYGLIPELVGRLPVITHTNKLSKEDMKQILTKPKNAIVKQYQKLFDIDGIKLHFNDDALDAIVEHTMDKELGARGLRSVIEDVMFKSMYEAPSEENLESLTITKKIVDERLSA